MAGTATKHAKARATGAARAANVPAARDHRSPRQASRRRYRRDAPLVQWLSDVGRSDITTVGGKNASLGEMINKLREAGISVPSGFATTAAAYWQLIEANDLAGRLAGKLGELRKDGRTLAAVGKAARKMILGAHFPAALSEAITRAYGEMVRRRGHRAVGVAVRSSASAEDLPEASFAGQLETFLNVRGNRALLAACKRCYIVTDRGGRTSHAAIVSRELWLPAIVGARDASRVLKDKMEVTVSCAEGDEGHVYAGIADFEVRNISIDKMPKTRTQVMINLADPAAAFRWWRLPADGVGLARMEFIIGNLIKVHPMALVHFNDLDDR